MVGERDNRYHSTPRPRPGATMKTLEPVMHSHPHTGVKTATRVLSAPHVRGGVALGSGRVPGEQALSRIERRWVTDLTAPETLA